MINGRNTLRFMPALLFILITALSPGEGVSSVSAAEASPQTAIQHDSLEYYVPGCRINVSAVAADPSGIELVRCYFKGSDHADFCFVNMLEMKSDQYQGVIPAPADATEKIEYLFLAVNGDKVVVKTQSFIVNESKEAEIPPWQDCDVYGEVDVFTELSQPPAEVAGFADSIALNAVESGMRFGAVAGGIYTASQIGSSTASVGAVNGGQITAASTGKSVAAAEAGSAAGAGGGSAGAGAGASAGLWASPWLYIVGGAVIAGGGYAAYEATKDEDEEEEDNVGSFRVWADPNPCPYYNYIDGLYYWITTVYVEETGGSRVDIEYAQFTQYHEGYQFNYAYVDPDYFAEWFDECGAGKSYIPAKDRVCGDVYYNAYSYIPVDSVFEIFGYDEQGNYVTGSVTINLTGNYDKPPNADTINLNVQGQVESSPRR